jgi:hypothetical protein
MNYYNMIDYLIVGLVSILTAYIIINFIILPEKKIELNNTKTYILVFLIGIIINYLVEISGLNNWYCGKRCLSAIKMLST